MSDIKYYNRSVLYYGDVVRTGHTPQHTRCQMTKLKDLFAAPDWYGFDSNDHVELCTCQTPVTFLNKFLHYSLFLDVQFRSRQATFTGVLVSHAYTNFYNFCVRSALSNKAKKLVNFWISFISI
jgi:hypothetical protein